MANPVVVYKGRTNVVLLNLGIDVSSDVITSEIRVGKSIDTDLIVTWDVEFVTDGTDGECRLTLDDSVSSVEEDSGFMDVKRVSGGEPYQVFSAPLKVLFKEVVTE